MYKSLILAVLVLGVVLGGCATIVGDSTQLVPISSTPGDATITITDEKGVVVFMGTTPTTATLHKSDGSYWGGKDFVVKINKEGFAEQTIELKSNANGWYIGGNIIFGGLIGWFIVDPFNGGMYTLAPKEVSTVLGEKGTGIEPVPAGSLKVVLLQDVPIALRDHLQRLN